uniref:Uncharacterized protein n=1 Tax=Arundo donax TaxID=35708 RepID=A0A0A9AT65_ARUDO
MLVYMYYPISAEKKQG